MRKSLIACVFVLTGCVSQSQPGMLSSKFDQTEAAQTRVSLGLTYLKNGNYTQAKKNLDMALEYAPRLADVHYSLAYYYQTVEEHARAIEYYDNAMDLAPRNADIANSYGAFLCEQGQYDDANKYFTKAVENQRYANTALTYENMGLCAREQGLHKQAIKYFITALNHQPSRGKTLLLLTQEYIDTQQWEKGADSLKRYEKMAQVTPESIWLAITLAKGRADLESMQSYGEMLQALYPDSARAKQYATLAEGQPRLKRTQKTHQTLTVPAAQQDASAAAASSTQSSVAARVAAANQQTRAAAQSAAQQTSESAAKQPDDAPRPTADSTQTVDDERVHIVQRNENLYRISLKYNIRMATLRSWNNLRDADALEEGSTLWLVPPEQQTNQVVE